MPSILSLTAAFLALLPAVLARDGFVLPPANKPLNVSAPIKIAWNRPAKPSDDWVGLVDVTAFFDWRSPEGRTGEAIYDVVSNRSSDEAGDVDWDPREMRAFLEANSTYAASVFFSGGYSKHAAGVRVQSSESRGWLTDSFRIEGHDSSSVAGVVRASLGGLLAAAAVGATMQML